MQRSIGRPEKRGGIRGLRAGVLASVFPLFCAAARADCDCEAGTLKMTIKGEGELTNGTGTYTIEYTQGREPKSVELITDPEKEAEIEADLDTEIFIKYVFDEGSTPPSSEGSYHLWIVEEDCCASVTPSRTPGEGTSPKTPAAAQQVLEVDVMRDCGPDDSGDGGGETSDAGGESGGSELENQSGPSYAHSVSTGSTGDGTGGNAGRIYFGGDLHALLDDGLGVSDFSLRSLAPGELEVFDTGLDEHRQLTGGDLPLSGSAFVGDDRPIIHTADAIGFYLEDLTGGGFPKVVKLHVGPAEEDEDVYEVQSITRTFTYTQHADVTYNGLVYDVLSVQDSAKPYEIEQYFVGRVPVTGGYHDYYFREEHGNIPAPGAVTTAAEGVRSRETSSEIDTTSKDRTFTEITRAGLAPAYATESVYHRFVFGEDELEADVWEEELVSSTVDPDGLALTTSYAYYSDPDSETVARLLGRLKSVSHPDGSWEAYDYVGESGTIEGVNYSYLEREYLPWQSNQSTPVAPANYGTYAGRVVATYHDPAGGAGGPVFRLETVGGQTVSKVGYSRAEVSAGVERATELHYDVTYGSSTETVTRRTVDRYDVSPAAAAHLRGRVYKEYAPDDGTGDPVAVRLHEYTLDAPNDRREAVSYELPLVDEGSAAHRTISDAAGRTLFTSIWVCTGESSSPDLDTHFEAATWTSHAYDALGWLVSREIDDVPEEQVSYDEDEEDETTIETRTAADGSVTVTVTDSLGHLVSSTAVGSGGAADIVTTHAVTSGTLGGATVEVRTTTTSAGGLSLTSVSKADLAGRPRSETGEDGLTATFAYTDAGRTTTATLPGGGTVIESRHYDGQAISRTGTAVVHEYYTYGVETNGMLWEKETVGVSEGPNARKSYRNRRGHEVRSETPGPNSNTMVETTAYNAAGLPVLRTPPAGDPTSSEYDLRGRVVLTGLLLNGGASLVEASLDRLRRFDYGYEKDSDNRWMSTRSVYVYPTNSSDTDVLFSEEKRRLGRLDGLLKEIEKTEMVDAAGVTATTVVDVVPADKLRRTVSTRSDVTNASESLAVNGRVVSASDFGVQDPVRFGYDALGRSTRVTRPGQGGTEITHYNGAGQVDYTVDAAGNATRYTYHGQGVAGAGQVATITNAMGEQKVFAYDLHGRVTTERGSGTYPVDYGYHSNYGWRTTMKTWRDLAGNVGDTTTWNHDAATGLLTSKVDAASASVSYSYTDDGLLERRTWARGKRTRYEYDADTRELVAVRYFTDSGEGTPDTDTTAVTGIAYNRLSQRVALTDAAGAHAYTNKVWGALDQEAITGSGILSGFTIDPGYNGSGQRTTFAASSSGASYAAGFGYEAATGRLSTVTHTAASRTATYAYLPSLNRPHKVTFRHSATDVMASTYGYDRAQRLATVRSELHTGGSAGVVSAHRYTHDAANRRTGAYREDTSYWEYAYNPRGEVTSGVKRLRGGAALAGHQFGYGYDDIGNRLAATSGGDASGANQRTTTYGAGTKAGAANARNQYEAVYHPGTFDVTGTDPDAAEVTISTSDTVVGQPAGASPQSHFRFEVDASSTTTAPGWDTVTVTGSNTAETLEGSFYSPPRTEDDFAYDADGNLTDDARWEYKWDGENRLIEMVTQGTATSVPKAKLEFAYDHMGRRIMKKVSSWVSSAWHLDAHHLFVYDGWNPVMRIDAQDSGAVDQKYFWGLDLSGSGQGAGGVGGLLFVDDGGAVHAPAYDGNGNVMEMCLVASSGAGVTAIYEYDPFGNTLRATGSFAAANPWRFSTKYADVEGGLVYYGYRYLSPSTGRWLGRDPIGEEGGLNLYGFAGNDGVNERDFLGLTIIEVEGNAFIPGRLGDWLPEPPGVTKWDFETDRRDFGGGSSRVLAVLRVDTKNIGRFDKTNVEVDVDGSGSRRRKKSDHTVVEFKAHDNTANIRSIFNSKDRCRSVIWVEASGGYPFIAAAPKINFSFSVGLTYSPSIKDKVSVQVISMQHNEFPNYEAIIRVANFKNVQAISFDTEGTGPGLLNLNESQTKRGRIFTYQPVETPG